MDGRGERMEEEEELRLSTFQLQSPSVRPTWAWGVDTIGGLYVGLPWPLH